MTVKQLSNQLDGLPDNLEVFIHVDDGTIEFQPLERVDVKRIKMIDDSGASALANTKVLVLTHAID